MPYNLEKVSTAKLIQGTDTRDLQAADNLLFRRFSALAQDGAFYNLIAQHLPKDNTPARISISLTHSLIQVSINDKQIPDIHLDSMTTTRRAVSDIFQEAMHPSMPSLRSPSPSSSPITLRPRNGRDRSSTPKSDASSPIHTPVRRYTPSASPNSGFSPLSAKPKEFPTKPASPKWYQKLWGWFQSDKNKRSNSSVSIATPKPKKKRRKKPSIQQPSFKQQSRGKLPVIPDSPSSIQEVQKVSLAPVSPTPSPIQRRTVPTTPSQVRNNPFDELMFEEL